MIRNAIYGFIVVSLFLTYTRCNSPSATEKVFIDEDSLHLVFGRTLFQDKRLSRDNSIACVDCHQPQLAFTDGRKKSIGIKGRTALRNAPSILNLENDSIFMYDGAVHTLEMQALIPITDSNEMGGSLKKIVRKLRSDSLYRHLSKKFYKKEINAFIITKELANFQRSLVARNSEFDKFITGDSAAVNSSAKLGWQLFQSLDCVSCHVLPDFTNNQLARNFISKDSLDLGRFRITGKKKDINRYKVPSLRNVTLTAPYLHNGELAQLSTVILRYQKGIHTKKGDTLLAPFQLTQEELNNLNHFFKTLVDTTGR